MAPCMAFLEQNEPDLAVVTRSWPELPDHIKSTILTLIKSAGVPTDANG